VAMVIATASGLSCKQRHHRDYDACLLPGVAVAIAVAAVNSFKKSNPTGWL